MVATIRPGNNTGDPWVVGIECVRYLPNGFIMGITNDKTSLGNDLKRKNNMQSPEGCSRGREKTVERNFHTSSSSKQLCPKNKY